MAIDISIIIPVYNGLEYTRECLQTLCQHSSFSCEIIVVNNASTDGTKAFLQEFRTKSSFITKIRSVNNIKNLGFAKACNQGFQKARGNYIVFLNNDTIMTPCWLEPLLACFETDCRAGMVTPKLLFPETGLIQYAGVGFSNNIFPYILSHRAVDRYGENEPYDVPGAGGACMVLTRKVLEEVGLFDENFINGLEDVDLSLRIKQAGYKTIYCPQSVVYHHESKTEGRFSHTDLNIAYYLKKWQGKIFIGKNGCPVFY